jgi:hypothetical protein
MSEEGGCVMAVKKTERVLFRNRQWTVTNKAVKFNGPVFCLHCFNVDETAVLSSAELIEIGEILIKIGKRRIHAADYVRGRYHNEPDYAEKQKDRVRRTRENVMTAQKV